MPFVAPMALAAIVMPSNTRSAYSRRSTRSLNVPGSPSSALHTTYFAPPSCPCAAAARFHFVPVGKPAPPRPRRFEADTSPMMSARLSGSAAASPWPGAIVSKVRGVFLLLVGCIVCSSPTRAPRGRGRVRAEHLAAVVDDPVHLLGAHPRVDAVVHEQRRPLVAHAQAAGPLEAEPPVGRGLAEADAQLVLELPRHARLARQVARNRLAQPDLEPAARLVMEERVERDDAVDLGRVDPDLVRHDLHREVRHRRVTLLQFLEDRHERGPRAPVARRERPDLVLELLLLAD